MTITEEGQDVLMGTIPWLEPAQSDIENGLGGDRTDSVIKDRSRIICLSRKRLAYFFG
ncbi:MAG: hypothetical protein ACLP51_11560 [Syntrophobacteraceae bacterium]